MEEAAFSTGKRDANPPRGWGPNPFRDSSVSDRNGRGDPPKASAATEAQPHAHPHDHGGLLVHLHPVRPGSADGPRERRRGRALPRVRVWRGVSAPYVPLRGLPYDGDQLCGPTLLDGLAEAGTDQSAQPRAAEGSDGGDAQGADEEGREPPRGAPRDAEGDVEPHALAVQAARLHAPPVQHLLRVAVPVSRDGHHRAGPRVLRGPLVRTSEFPRRLPVPGLAPPVHHPGHSALTGHHALPEADHVPEAARGPRGAGRSGMIVAIGGPPGSGKTTAAELYARTYGCVFISGGRMFREMAAEQGMDILAYSAHAEKHHEVDRRLDDMILAAVQHAMTNRDVVVDGRIQAHLLARAKTPAFCVLVTAP